jgi:hypothetical protein
MAFHTRLLDARSRTALGAVDGPENYPPEVEVSDVLIRSILYYNGCQQVLFGGSDTNDLNRGIFLRNDRGFGLTLSEFLRGVDGSLPIKKHR